jgi:hypothetical protein
MFRGDCPSVRTAESGIWTRQEQSKVRRIPKWSYRALGVLSDWRAGNPTGTTSAVRCGLVPLRPLPRPLPQRGRTFFMQATQQYEDPVLDVGVSQNDGLLQAGAHRS